MFQGLLKSIIVIITKAIVSNQLKQRWVVKKTTQSEPQTCGKLNQLYEEENCGFKLRPLVPAHAHVGIPAGKQIPPS